MPQEQVIYTPGTEEIEESILNRILPSRAAELEREKKRREELEAVEREIRERSLLTPAQRAKTILDEMRGGPDPSKKRKVFNLISDVVGMVGAGVPPASVRARRQAMEEYKAETQALGREQTVIGAEQRATLSAQQRAETSRENQALRYIDIKRREAMDLAKQAEMVGNQELKNRAIKVAEGRFALEEDLAPIRKELVEAQAKFAQAGTKTREFEPEVLADTFSRAMLGIGKEDDPTKHPQYQKTYIDKLNELTRAGKQAPQTTVRVIPAPGPFGEARFFKFDRGGNYLGQLDTGRKTFSDEDQRQVSALGNAISGLEEMFYQVADDPSLVSLNNLAGRNALTFFRQLTPQKQALFQQNARVVIEQVRAASGLQTSNQERAFINQQLPTLWGSPELFLQGAAFFRNMLQAQLYRTLVGVTPNQINQFDMSEEYKKEFETISKAISSGQTTGLRLRDGREILALAASKRGFELEVDDSGTPIGLVRK